MKWLYPLLKQNCHSYNGKLAINAWRVPLVLYVETLLRKSAIINEIQIPADQHERFGWSYIQTLRVLDLGIFLLQILRSVEFCLEKSVLQIGTSFAVYYDISTPVFLSLGKDYLFLSFLFQCRSLGKFCWSTIPFYLYSKYFHDFKHSYLYAQTSHWTSNPTFLLGSTTFSPCSQNLFDFYLILYVWKEWDHPAALHAGPISKDTRNCTR